MSRKRTNKPLTLEQLRGIDGQPVWIKDLKTYEPKDGEEDAEG